MGADAELDEDDKELKISLMESGVSEEDCDKMIKQVQ